VGAQLVTKACIACAEQIQVEAKLCRFCQTLQNDSRFGVISPGIVGLPPLKVGEPESIFIPYWDEATSEYNVCDVCGTHTSRGASRCYECLAWLNLSGGRFWRTEPHPDGTWLDKSTSNYTVCEVCGKHNSKDQPKCATCNGLLDHDSSSYIVGAEGKTPKDQNSDVSHLGPTPAIAIAAIICSFLVPVLGLILGYTARTEIRNKFNPKEGEGLAVGAIVIGWIWIILLVIWVIAAVIIRNRLANF